MRNAWESLTTLLLLVMTIAWLVSASFVYALIPGLTFLESLCIAACVTPTDPVLANSVVKGRFAEKYIPPHVRNIMWVCSISACYCVHKADCLVPQSRRSRSERRSRFSFHFSSDLSYESLQRQPKYRLIDRLVDSRRLDLPDRSVHYYWSYYWLLSYEKRQIRRAAQHD